MNKKHSNFIADAAFLALLILLFVCIIFISTYSNNLILSTSILCIIFAFMIITHFTTITMGLILNIVAIFGYSSYLLYSLFVTGTPINSESYFWIVMCPVLTFCSSIIFRHTRELEEQNDFLAAQVKNFSDIDEKTGLKNKRAYEIEMPVYSSISKRYNIKLLLIVWEFKYGEDLKRMLGKAALERISIKVSKVMKESFRKEDVLYILSDEPYLWGTLLLTNDNGGEILMDRIKNKFDSIEIDEISGKNAPKLEMRVGMEYLSAQEETIEGFLEKAINKMQYDV